MEVETQLPLTNPANCVQVNNVLDLSKSYLLSHTQLTVQKVINLTCCNIQHLFIHSVIVIISKIK